MKNATGRVGVVAAGFAVLGLAGAAAGQGAELTILPRLPDGGVPMIKGVSGDGQVVFGLSGRDHNAFRWRRDSGFEMLPVESPFGSVAVYSCNGDGSVVAGHGSISPIGPVAFTWGPGGEVTVLNDALGRHLITAYAISDDARVVLGETMGATRQAAYWTTGSGPGAGLTVMPDLPTGIPPTWLSATNADGTVFAGSRIGAGGLAFRWSAQDGYTIVGTLGGVIADASVHGINSTGEIIVGDSSAAGGGRPAYMWTPYHGIERLALPAGDVSATATGLSADGRVVVGQSIDAQNHRHAMLYTQGLGSVRLEEYLNTEYGFNLASSSLYNAFGVSHDGRTIVGGGNALGYWVLTLPQSRPADFNVDQFVDFLDLADFLDCFEGTSVLPPSSADLNHDGFTDFFDLIEFIDRFQ